MEISAAERLHIIIGTRNGLTLSAPFVVSTLSCSQSVSRPPTPVPIKRPGTVRVSAHRLYPAGVIDRLVSGRRRQLDKAVRPAHFFRPEQAAYVEASDRPHPADRCRAEQALPEPLDPDAARGRDAEAGDDHPSTGDGPRAVRRAQDSQHQSLDVTSS